MPSNPRPTPRRQGVPQSVAVLMLAGALVACWRLKVWLDPSVNVGELAEHQVLVHTVARVNRWVRNPDAENLQELRDSLVSSNPSERRAALRALAAIGPAPEVDRQAVAVCLNGADPKLRREALSAWVAIHANPVEAVPGLIERLNDESDAVRISATSLLEQIGDESAPFLAQYLVNGAEFVGRDAYSLLRTFAFDDPAVVRVAHRDCAGGMATELALGAAAYLLTVGQASLSEIEQAIGSSDDALSGAAIAAAMNLGDRALPFETAIETRLSAGLEFHIGQALIATDRRRELQLRSPEPLQPAGNQVPWGVLAAIGARRPEFVTARLESVARLGSAEIRELDRTCSWNTLARLDGGPSRIVDALLPAVRDRNVWERSMIRFIAEQTPEAATEIVDCYLAHWDDDSSLNSRTQELIGGLGPLAAPAVREFGKRVENDPLPRRSLFLLDYCADADWLPAELVPIYERLLASPDVQSRTTALRHLARHRRSAEPLRPALVALLVRECDAWDRLKEDDTGDLPVTQAGVRAPTIREDARSRIVKCLRILIQFDLSDSESQFALQRWFQIPELRSLVPACIASVQLTPEQRQSELIAASSALDSVDQDVQRRGAAHLASVARQSPEAVQVFADFLSGRRHREATGLPLKNDGEIVLPRDKVWWDVLPIVLEQISGLGPEGVPLCELLRGLHERFGPLSVIEVVTESGFSGLPLSERLTRRRDARATLRMSIERFDRMRVAGQ